MEIIKKGRHPDERVLDGNCSYCKTVVRFSVKEGKHHSAYDQRDSEYWSINCPVCTRQINCYKPYFLEDGNPYNVSFQRR